MLRESIGHPLPPSIRAEHEHTVATAHSQLDDAAFAATWAEGRAMKLEQAIAYALERSAVDTKQPAPAAATAK